MVSGETIGGKSRVRVVCKSEKCNKCGNVGQERDVVGVGVVFVGVVFVGVVFCSTIELKN